MKYFESISPIIRQYNTGEEPVLVECSDARARVCKYSRSSAIAFKLACEVIGAELSQAWELDSPVCDFVHIKPEHVPNYISPNLFSRSCIGTEFREGVVDITSSSLNVVPCTKENIVQLLRIALFDFWIGNEDRNANNANLMYDIQDEKIVPIGYGCIFNTATFEFKLSQLTSTDTILYGDLFRHLVNGMEVGINKVLSELDWLFTYYNNSLSRSKTRLINILDLLPTEWNLPKTKVEDKLQELFNPDWINGVWENFNECLLENTKNNE